MPLRKAVFMSRWSFNASPAASATTSAARVGIDCTNCSKLGVGILVHEFVLHEQSVKFLKPLHVLHEARGLEQAADGQRERMCGSVLLVDPVDRLIDDVAVPVE